MLISGVEEGVRQLGIVNMKDISTQKVSIHEVAVNLASQFTITFTTLLKIMKVQEEKAEAKREKLTKLQSQASQVSSMPMLLGSTLKHLSPNSTSTIPPPMKCQKLGYESDTSSPPWSPLTPDQPIVKVD